MHTAKCLAILFLGVAAGLRAQTPVSLAEVAADPKIWPAEVMVTVDHKLPVVIDGKTAKTLKVGPGKIYRVKEITDSSVSVQGLGSLIVFKEDETDVLARAGQVRAHLAALAAATPTPAATPAADPPKAPRVAATTASDGLQIHRGPLPFSLKLPPGFAGPIFHQEDSEKGYLYFRKNASGSNRTIIQIVIDDLISEKSNLSVDELMQATVENSRNEGWNIETSPAENGQLGSIPARVLPWKGDGKGKLGPMSGRDWGFVRNGRFYSVTIADSESDAPKSFPELTQAIQTLQFGERPPIETGQEVAGAAPAPGTLAARLGGQLVSLNGGQLQPFDVSKLTGKKYLAVYFSASWCGPCRRFTPTLVQWYESRKAVNSNFELIFVSSDRNEREMVSYMAADHMRWPAVAFHSKRGSPLAKYGGRGIPCLVILDENGSVLAHSYEGDRYLGPMEPLQELDRLLKGS